MIIADMWVSGLTNTLLQETRYKTGGDFRMHFSQKD